MLELHYRMIQFLIIAHIDEFCIFMNTAIIDVLETKQDASVPDS